MELLLIGTDLMKQRLLIVKIFISILVHFCVIFPVIFMHPVYFFLAFCNALGYLCNPLTQLIQYIGQILDPIFIVCHSKSSLFVIPFQRGSYYYTL
mgnify:CR=1 FL=1